VTLRTWIVVILAPLADPARLAPTTVSDLALCCLHAHGFEWASHLVGGTLRAVVALRALPDRGVWYGVETSLADVASHTFVNLNACTAIPRLWALETHVRSDDKFVGKLISARRAERLALESELASTSRDARDWRFRVNRVTEFSDRARCADR